MAIGTGHARIDFRFDEAVDGERGAGQQPDADGAGNQDLPAGKAIRRQEHADDGAEYGQLRHARLRQRPVLGDAIGALVGNGLGGHGCGFAGDSCAGAAEGAGTGDAATIWYRER
jgi:hypothetical protein